MPVVERLLRVQIVAAVVMVARNRETYTCTMGQKVAVVAVVARRETSTQMVAMVEINQKNSNTSFTLELMNCLSVQPLYAEPCQFFYCTVNTSL